MGGRNAAAAAPPSEVRRQWIMGPASPGLVVPDPAIYFEGAADIYVFPLVKIRIP
jgi:hypothetical protein